MAGQTDAFIGAFEGAESPDQAPGGIGEDGTAQARMHILGGGLDRELNVANAAQAGVLDGGVFVVHAAKFPDAGIGLETFDVVFDEVFEVQAADFFFTFDGEFDTAGKLAINSDVFTQAGDYTITVESPGYMNSTVKQTINGPPAYTVTFTVTNGTNPIQGAAITIAEQNVTTDADGKATIDVEDGTYAYSVTATGFNTITDGSVTVNGAALAEAVTMTANPAGLTDAEKVAVAKANLNLGDISAVTADLTLPGTQNDATVTWTSSNTDVIANDGKVTRPAAGQPDANVTLTAKITAGEAMRAFRNTSRIAFSDSPTHLLKTSGPLIDMKFASLSVATALAKSVFPQPGGP